MLKIVKPDEENEPSIIEDERGVRRKGFYEDSDDASVFGGATLGNSRHDDLDDLGGILPDLDRNLENCQIAVERLKGERARALRNDQLALYLALETKVARLSGYAQGLTFVRERLGDGAPGLFEEGSVFISLDDSLEAQAKLDGIVRRIETLLAKRAEQENLN